MQKQHSYTQGDNLKRYVYLLALFSTASHAVIQKKEDGALEEAISFLKTMKIEHYYPLQGSLVSLKNPDNIVRLNKVASKINAHTKKLKLNKEFIEHISPNKYNEESITKLQLKCAIYMAERIGYNINPSELYLHMVNPECARMIQTKDNSYSANQTASPQKICITAQLISALKTPSSAHTSKHKPV